MPAKVWLLIIGMALNVTGSSFLWPINTIFMHEHLGKSLTVAGLVLLMNSGAGIIGNLTGGLLFDRLGGYRTIMLGVLISFTTSFLLIWFHDFWSYSILLVFMGFGMGIVFPSMYALAGTMWKEGGRKAFNRIYIAQNVGVALGAALGGLAASYSFTLSFISCASLSFFFLMIVWFGFKGIDEKKSGGVQTVFSQKKRIHNKPAFIALLILCGGYLLAWIGYVQWQSTIASYTQDLGVTLKMYSLLWTVNGLFIVLGQPLVNLFLKKWLHSTSSQILVGYVIFIVSFIIVGNAKDLSGFMIAMVVLTIGEMLVWPGVPSIAAELAPQGRAGFYQGIVNSTATGGRMLGPLFGGMVADLFNISILFQTIMGLMVIAFMLTIVYSRNRHSFKKQDTSQPAAL
ncbi:MFS transporter [Fictibacillus nanhaiensis]|uniref:MDR family MFS transporter n=1 Tax=Fictibacillus nanhaiensis TaxID=742169 RepID=UPI00203D34A4|nr:MFS transporter [Fictibacillus nanhaiensis]MCM3731096.1 MFS transporter [Fictibacillus nanhaiensis]